jgi:zinc D-Ala-D-Ala carboxypeptidase
VAAVAFSAAGCGSAQPASPGAGSTEAAGGGQATQPTATPTPMPTDTQTPTPGDSTTSSPASSPVAPSPSIKPGPTQAPAKSVAPTPPAKPVTGPVQAAAAAAPPGTLVTNAEALPGCAYSYLPTPLAGQADYALTLLDTTYSLSSSYQPAGLVRATVAGSGELVRSLIVPDLRSMVVAARAAGAPLAIASAYRSYANQVVTFRHWVNVQGYARALTSSARPGHSEHQLGTAIDFKSRGGPDPWTMADWGKQSAAGIWMAANAWKYGFVMSYPRGQIARTCYEYEPWHYRYVGVAEAAAIRASGLTPRQWIWEHQPNPELPSPQ